MDNQQQNTNSQSSNNANKDDTIGGVPTNTPDAEEQNDTGYAGTTNAVSENHQDKDGYKIAIEDTMIGYDGNDEQLDMDLGDEDRLKAGTRGIDDND